MNMRTLKVRLRRKPRQSQNPTQAGRPGVRLNKVRHETVASPLALRRSQAKEATLSMIAVAVMVLSFVALVLTYVLVHSSKWALGVGVVIFTIGCLIWKQANRAKRHRAMESDAVTTDDEAPSQPKSIATAKDTSTESPESQPISSRRESRLRQTLLSVCTLGLLPYLQLRREQKDLTNRVAYWLKRDVKFIFTFANVKSSTKSTVATLVMSLLTEISRKFGIIIPATMSTSTATVAFYAGIDEGDYITVTEYSGELAKFTEYDRLSNRIPRTPHGLGVVSEDEGNETSAGGAYGEKQFMAMALNTVPKTDILALDQGNDNIQPGSIGLASAQLAHAIFLPFHVALPGSQVCLKRTMAQLLLNSAPARPYAALVSESDTDGPAAPASYSKVELSTGIPIAMEEKLKHAVIVGSLGYPGFDFAKVAVPSFSKKMQNPPAFAWEGVGLSIPEDKHLAQLGAERKDGSTVTFLLRKLSLKTRVAGLRVAVAGIETAVFLQGIDLQDYKPVFVVPEPEPAKEETTAEESAETPKATEWPAPPALAAPVDNLAGPSSMLTPPSTAVMRQPGNAGPAHAAPDYDPDLETAPLPVIPDATRSLSQAERNFLASLERDWRNPHSHPQPVPGQWPTPQ